MRELADQAKGDKRELTQSQLMIWTGQQLSPLAPLYNMAMTFEFNSSIDTVVFKKAFQKLVEKVTILRTVFDVENDIPKQYIYGNLSDQLSLVDFSIKADPASSLEKYISEKSQRVFYLFQPLFDSALIKMEEEQYVWYLNLHHLITDGWSFPLLYELLDQFYKKELQGKAVNDILVPEYADFVSFEKKNRSKLVDDTNYKAYWKSKEEELPALPRLYGQSIRTLRSSSKRIYIDLGKERTEKLRALTQEPDLRAWSEDLSLYPLFASILFAFIYRVSGQSKLAIGSISHNRTKPVFKQMPGLFMEIFPLLVNVAKTDSFLSLFEKVRTEVFDVMKHSQPGFSTPSLHKKINVVLNYINAQFAPFNDQKVKSKWVHPNHHDPKHHIRLQIHDFDNTGRIQLLFDLNSDVFDETMCAVIPDHFINLLDQFIEDRSQSISARSFISANEKQKILTEFNNPNVDFNNDNTLVKLFEKQVAKTPSAIALIFDNKEVTYQELNQKTNQLAHFLQKNNIGSGKIVAVVMERSIEMVVALYAIMKAGCAYLPISPKDPANRIKFIIEDANSPLVLTQDLFLDKLSIVDRQLITLGKDWKTIQEESIINLELNITKENLAYTIYTSGSTGQPKGVLITHEAIVNRLHWIQDLHPLNSTDKVLKKTPYTFDVSVWELFWPLQNGAQLVIAKPEGHKDNRYLIELISQHQITIIHFVPSMLSLFLEEDKVDTCHSLRQVYCSGEVLTMKLQKSFFEKLDSELFNLYGPTETTIEVSYWRCDKATRLDFVPIGKTVPNTQLYILDEYLNLVPNGVVGELHVGGIQLANGYLNREDLTAEKFIPDPFSLRSGAKLYKTGDLARFHNDGIIQYLGRLDEQIKLRGFRIELGEIESALCRHPKVNQAVVSLIVGEKELVQQQLVAYYSGTEELSDDLLRSFLGGQLPEYMLPNVFIQVEEFKLSSSGKIDKKSLALLTEVKPKGLKNYVAPRTDIEVLLVEVWEEVLQADQISIYDNFIDMGGHSLLAIRLMSRINDRFELDLPLQLIFEKQTIATMAEDIEETIQELLKSLED